MQKIDDQGNTTIVKAFRAPSRWVYVYSAPADEDEPERSETVGNEEHDFQDVENAKNIVVTLFNDLHKTTNAATTKTKKTRAPSKTKRSKDFNGPELINGWVYVVHRAPTSGSSSSKALTHRPPEGGTSQK